jgi:hypothetical protein
MASLSKADALFWLTLEKSTEKPIKDRTAMKITANSFFDISLVLYPLILPGLLNT